MINFENLHTSHTIWTQQVILRVIYVYINRCMNVTTIDEKEATNKREQGGLYGRFLRKEEKGKYN